MKRIQDTELAKQLGYTPEQFRAMVADFRKSTADPEYWLTEEQALELIQRYEGSEP